MKTKSTIGVVVAMMLGAIPGRVMAQASVVARPDTLGAQFDDATPGTGSPTDWDFLLGSSKFQTQNRDPATGGFSALRTGTWTAVKTHDGFLIDDEFATLQPDGSRALTVTYRVFDATKKQWNIQGVAARRGIWQPGISWSTPTDRYLVQDNPGTGTKLRIHYYNITPNHFQWRADGSRDGGKTWVRDVILIEATRDHSQPISKP